MPNKPSLVINTSPLVALGSSTVIVRTLTQCEMDSGSTGYGIYCKGVNATLTINTNSTVFFANSLGDRGNGLFYSQTSGRRLSMKARSNSPSTARAPCPAIAREKT